MVEVVVLVGLTHVMSFMSTRRSAKPVKKRPASIQEELQKSFPTANASISYLAILVKYILAKKKKKKKNALPDKTPDHLEP